MSQSDHADRAPVRLLLVDDHQVLRIGLRTLFEEVPEAVTVVGEAGTLAEGVALAQTLRPDVVLLDLRLPDGHGIEGCREIRSRCPDIKVLFLTSYVDDEALMSTVMAGAQGYLLKEVNGETLVHAILKVAAGGACLDPVLAERVRGRLDALSDSKRESTGLSPQEQRILSHLSEGLTNKEIALAMGLSEKTVRNYLTSVFSKLNVSRRAEAVSHYLRRHQTISTPSHQIP